MCQLAIVESISTVGTYQVLKGRDEVVHTQDTVDVSRIVTEEDTTKGRKGTHEVGLEGDGGLDAQGVDGAPGGGGTTRHCGLGSRREK